MRGGGEIVDGVWLVRAKLLRPGDEICAAHWNDMWWCGGEVLIVLQVEIDSDKSYVLVETVAKECRVSDRQLSILGEDRVVMCAREIEEREPRPEPKPRAKPGDQLKLF